MGIRTILVNLDVDFYSPGILECAVSLATWFDAKLIGLAAAEPSTAAVGFAGAVALAAAYGEERQEIKTRLHTLETEFRLQVPAKLRLDWRAAIESPNDSLLVAAKRADLILTGTYSGKDASRLHTVDVGELVTSAGRPVLAVGRHITALTPDKIVIGWKDTREARRAVADALPLLQLAHEVVIATVSEGESITEKASLEGAIAWLSQHGVTAREEVVSTGVEGVGAALMSVARSADANLVVSGAYGHSRAREWFFGGMTRDLLATENANRFLSN
jgi:nucleotide-binding universal stress UspA family protein